MQIHVQKYVGMENALTLFQPIEMMVILSTMMAVIVIVLLKQDLVVQVELLQQLMFVTKFAEMVRSIH